MTIKKFPVPILVVGFKRPDKLVQVLNSIEKIKPEKVYFFVDAARDGFGDELILVDSSKKIIDEFIARNSYLDGVHFLYPKNNLGVSRGPAEAITWLFSMESYGIVLEDDCVPDQSFYSFCAEKLEEYQSNSNIGMIQGFNPFPINNGANYHLISKYSLCWGAFATWADRWCKFDRRIFSWPAYGNTGRLRGFCNGDLKIFLFWKSLFQLVYVHPEYGWDTQWTYALISNELKSIVPGINIVDNIGYADSMATSTKDKKPKHIENAGVGSVGNSTVECEQDISKKYDEKVEWIHFYIGWPKILTRITRNLLESNALGKFFIKHVIQAVKFPK